jgi:hypothetical protein
MTIASGVFKKVALKKQTALGTIAPAGAGGTSQYLRRVTSAIDLGKATFASNEIVSTQQRRDMRHGVKSVAGTLTQELSVGGHQKQMESVLRQLAQAVVTKTATTIAATAGAAGSAQVTYADSGNGLLTAGFKVGDVVDVSGFTTGGVANNVRAVILTVAAGSMTVLNLGKIDGATKVAGDSVTIVQAGKKTYIPSTGHTRDYYTLEHWFADVAQSEVFTDVVFTGMQVNIPPNGMATVAFPVMGLNAVMAQAQYFTSPAAEPTGNLEAGLNGAVLVNGTVVGYITGLSINVNGNYTVPGGVIGQNVDPDVFPGVIDVTGQVTVLFQDQTMRDLFISEGLASIVAVLVDSTGVTPGFTAFVMSKCKFTDAAHDDGNKSLTLTMPFTALENTAGGAALANLQTTISVQDSAFV